MSSLLLFAISASLTWGGEARFKITAGFPLVATGSMVGVQGGLQLGRSDFPVRIGIQGLIATELKTLTSPNNEVTAFHLTVSKDLPLTPRLSIQLLGGAGQSAHIRRGNRTSGGNFAETYEPVKTSGFSGLGSVGLNALVTPYFGTSLVAGILLDRYSRVYLATQLELGSW